MVALLVITKAFNFKRNTCDILTQKPHKQKSILLLLPIVGALVFIVLYFIATILYPGGSQVDKNAVGFSWINNYWCNLLNDEAINGQYNSAKPIALIALFILCCTLSFFWFAVSIHFNIPKKLKKVIQASGLLAGVAAFLLFTNLNHDMIINLASGFGLIATVGTLITLYKNNWQALFAFGLMNILQVAINNYVYYTSGLIVYLPLVQKISFASFLIWMCCICTKLYNRSQTHISGV